MDLTNVPNIEQCPELYYIKKFFQRKHLVNVGRFTIRRDCIILQETLCRLDRQLQSFRLL